jgi:exodeoxyribonuclease V alpha subunit
MYHSEEEVSISTASEVNSLLLGYVLTVHKSQGSEWRKVFLILHQSHNIMLQRELLYTACTRPREELYIICEPNSFEKGILSQRIKGNTLAEKAEYLKLTGE